MTSARFPQRIDRLAITLMIVLGLLTAGLLWGGQHATARVREFSWQDKQVGADDTAFILTFSRPMDQASVEKNLRITPPLPGKISWAGRRMAYTLTTPAPYGTSYRVQLEGARDRLSSTNAIRPFTGKFSMRDRAFVYIGVQGEEAGRLIFYNLTKQEKVMLTPPDLVVMDLKPYPLGDRVLISAVNRTATPQGVLAQKLYTVTTGIQIQPPRPVANTTEDTFQSAAPAGTLKLLLDNEPYQNLRFDLSANGKIIVVHRINRHDPVDFGPWILREDTDPQPLKGEPGGDFLLTPDSDSLAISQGQGLAILPLEPDAKPLNFLPKFGRVLRFSRDGTLAAMVKFNPDRTRSLVLVSNQGTGKELVRTTGSVLGAVFAPTKQVLYALLSELIPGEIYREDPYIAAIDLKSGELKPLVQLPGQRDVHMSLSPDGLALLFDQTVQTVEDGQTGRETVRNSEGKAIADSRLWLLPVGSDQGTVAKLEPLPLPGLRPVWLP
jgi:hypothetical protein